MLDTKTMLTGLLVAPTPRIDGKPVEHPYMPQLNAILAAEARISLIRAKKLFSPAKISKTLLSEVADAEFVVADVSHHLPGVYFYMGLAKALKKPLITLSRHGSKQSPWVQGNSDFVIQFETTPSGLEDFARKLKEAFATLLRAQALDHQVLMGDYRKAEAFMAEEDDEDGGGETFDWSGLSPGEHENLCLEILLRQGLEQVTWLEQTNEIDISALRPLDDGTHDFYLVAIGSSLDDNLTMQLLINDLQKVFDRIVEISQTQRLRRADGKFVLNLLFIWSPENKAFAVTKGELQELHERVAKVSRQRFTVRGTVWTRRNLESFVRQSPMLVRKYFTQEWRDTAGHRKTAEELYREASSYVQRAVDAAHDLEKKYGKDPGKKWQQLAYTAIHSIGNAIFPVEVYVDQLREMMEETGDRDGMLAVERAQANVEKAKVHIKKFKSIASDRESWTPAEIDIVPNIDRSLATARSRGVKVELYYQERPEVLADSDQVDEIFDEFVANSLNWLEKTEEPCITVTVKVAGPDDLLPGLDDEWGYLWVRYADNGPGVKHEVKSKIFELFYSESMQGMGFGLAIARKNMRSFGGEVIETGTPGLGAQFDFFFRIAQ